MASLSELLAAHRPGHALEREFHLERLVYDQEIKQIWRRSWLFAGFSLQAAAPGEFFRFELGDGSIIVVRGQDGDLRALHNTCRHRGMAVCQEPAGTAKRFVCPYHQWSYGLDGRLLGAGGMEREIDEDGRPLLDPAAYGLPTAPVTEVGGLIYVWPGNEPPQPFEQARASLAAALEPQGLERARIAHSIEYRVRANWKLVWENNRECWHCHLGHPEYIQANFDSAADNERNREAAARREAEHAAVLSEAGLGATTATLAGAEAHGEPGLYQFPTPGYWWSANRTPLVDGFVTESLDGKPVAPLMGSYSGRDVGTLRVRTVPNFWSHASSDHAVVTRLVPAGPEQTRVTVFWLVDREAEQGRDYELERLLPFWQLTSEQDWSLCERNHAGVRSPAYTPGPYSPAREYNVSAFTDWYLQRLGA
jgi:glycine betaine catabolism A